MASKKELQEIYKEVAEIISELKLIFSINNYYDIFCNKLQITKYLNIDNITCLDKSQIKINLLNAFQNDNIEEVKNIVSAVINKYTTDIENENCKQDMNDMLEILSEVYSEYTPDTLDIKSIEDWLEYNSVIRADRFNKHALMSKLNQQDIKFECKEFNETEFKDNSLIMCYAPFRKTDIMSDKFPHKTYFNWLDNKAKEDNSNTYLVLSYENPGEQYEVYKSFETSTKKQIKLFIDKKSLDKINKEFSLESF